MILEFERQVRVTHVDSRCARGPLGLTRVTCERQADQTGFLQLPARRVLILQCRYLESWEYEYGILLGREHFLWTATTITSRGA